MNLSTMAIRCLGARYIGAASLNGFRFEINTRGVATVIPHVKNKVYGVLWHLNGIDEQILDLYEGVDSGLYTKHMGTITLLGNNKQVQVMVYIASESTAGKPIDSYMKDILVSAMTEQLPTEYMDHLRSMLNR